MVTITCQEKFLHEAVSDLNKLIRIFLEIAELAHIQTIIGQTIGKIS